MWDVAKQFVGKFIAMQFYLMKEKSQINYLSLHLKQLEKEEEIKSKDSRREEIIKIRGEINEIEMEKKIAKISKTKSWFFEKKNRIVTPLARLIKKRRGLKSIKLEMKEETLKLISQIYKGLKGLL